MKNPTMEQETPRAARWPSYTYQDALSVSERIGWRVEDVIGGEKRLDWGRRFLPESLARVEPLAFLSAEEKRVLNQIRGHGYLYVFGLVEEFILPFVLDHARPLLSGDDARVRALLAFAGEEAKHIQLFKRFREEFLAGFGSPCEVIGPPEAVAQAVLSHHPLGVALVILQIEWMTQRHYVDSVQDDGDLDPQFKSLLRHHWMEEAQHAKLDTLMVQAMTERCTPEEIDRGIEDYVKIGGLLDGGLMQQVEMDLTSLERKTGRRLGEAERARFLEVQRQASRWTFLGSGMSHRNVMDTMERVRPGMRARLMELTPLFS